MSALNNWKTVIELQTSTSTPLGLYKITINANNNGTGTIPINMNFDFCAHLINGTPGPSPTSITTAPPTGLLTPTPTPQNAAESALSSLAFSLVYQPGSGLCGSECAQVVNNIAQRALGHAFVSPGVNQDWVPDLRKGILQNGYGTLLVASTTLGGAMQAHAGDIAIQDGYSVDECAGCPGEEHVGICLNEGCTLVAGNSNSGCDLLETNNTFSDNGYPYDPNAVTAFYHIDH